MKLASALDAIIGKGGRRPPVRTLSRPLRIGIVGAGKAGAYHLDALRGIEGAQPAFLVNRGSVRAAALAARHGVGLVAADLAEALDKAPIDAAIVAVPPAATLATTLMLLERGVPCLVEKPPGVSADEAVRLAAAAGTLPATCIAFNRRFMTGPRRAYELATRLPGIYAIHIEAPEPIDSLYQRKHKPDDELRQWEMVNSIHAVDLFTLFAGPASGVVGLEPPMPFKTRPSREDFTALIRFENGVAGTYVSHWHSPGKWRLELFGPGFRIAVDLHSNRLTVLDDEHPTRTIAPDPEDRHYKPGIFLQDWAFLDAVARGKAPERPAASPADGIASMRLIETLRTAGWPDGAAVV